MCTGLEVLLVGAAVGGTALSAYGQIQQGREANKAAIAQGEQMSEQAGQEEDAAAAQAERIRKAARSQVGEARAALSASGVSAEEGSALQIQEQIIKDSESDALATILTGKRRGSTLSDNAMNTRRQGAAAQRAGQIGAVGTVLSNAGSYGRASGWKGGTGGPAAVTVNG